MIVSQVRFRLECTVCSYLDLLCLQREFESDDFLESFFISLITPERGFMCVRVSVCLSDI